MNAEDLGEPVERLRLAPDEVLVVRPRAVLTSNESAILHRNLAKLAQQLNIPHDRIIVLSRDIDISVVKADQMELV